MLKIKLLFYFTILISFSLSAQNSEWVQYTNGDNVTCQAIEGNINWIGTEGGLVKLNKETGETEFYNNANSGLAYNYISCITIDENGNKWIGNGGFSTYGGLLKFDGNNWTIYNNENSPLIYNKINSITIDEIGNKWIGTKYEGLVYFDDTNWTFYNIDN